MKAEITVDFEKMRNITFEKMRNITGDTRRDITDYLFRMVGGVLLELLGIQGLKATRATYGGIKVKPPG